MSHLNGRGALKEQARQPSKRCARARGEYAPDGPTREFLGWRDLVAVDVTGFGDVKYSEDISQNAEQQLKSEVFARASPV